MNDTSKSIFASVTFWGLVLGALGPLAAHFGYTLPADTTGVANQVAGIIGDLIALYGRLRATQPVHVISAPSGGQAGFASVRLLILTALVSLAIACASTPQTPAQSVYVVKAGYAEALTVAVAYKQLPSCAQSPRPALCSEAAVVAKLQAADDAAFSTLKAAEDIVRSPAAGMNVQTAIAAAQQALNALTSITATLTVK